MIDTAKSWFKENSTLVLFLAGQAVAIGAVTISIVAYMVRLETRVVTLEVRGSPHLAEINNRLTVLESTTKDNKDRLQKVVDIMTKELHIAPGAALSTYAAIFLYGFVVAYFATRFYYFVKDRRSE